jgi:hypothetical protein
MKLLIEIEDTEAAAFIKMLKGYSFLKAKALSGSEAQLLDEINEIKKAFKHAGQVKSGALKARSVEDLLNEL